MIVAEEVGKRIVELRHQKGFTQEQLGQKLNVSGQAVSKWENGDSLPDTTLLVSLANTFECTIDYLLGADQQGGVSRFFPTLEAELKEMKPEQKIDLAFKLFHLIDMANFETDGLKSLPFFESNVSKNGLPLVHAGRHFSVWWKGKFLCIASRDALRETATAFNDEHLPFDLFSKERAELLTVFLEQDTQFNRQVPITETSIKEHFPTDVDYKAILNEWMDSGILQQGRGGFLVEPQAEIVLRLLGVLLRSVGKPGVISINRSTPPEQDDKV